MFSPIVILQMHLFLRCFKDVFNSIFLWISGGGVHGLSYLLKSSWTTEVRALACVRAADSLLTTAQRG